MTMNTVAGISAEKLVNGARGLLPYYPRPTAHQIDDVLSRLCKAFEVPFTVESDAKLLWRKHVGLVNGNTS